MTDQEGSDKSQKTGIDDVPPEGNPQSRLPPTGQDSERATESTIVTQSKAAAIADLPPKKSPWETAAHAATAVGLLFTVLVVGFNGWQIHSTNANNKAQIVAQLITGSTALYQSMMQNPKEFAPLFEIPEDNMKQAVAIKELLSYYNAIFFYDSKGFIDDNDLIDTTRAQLCQLVRRNEVRPQVQASVKNKDYPRSFTQVLVACLEKSKQ